MLQKRWTPELCVDILYTLTMNSEKLMILADQEKTATVTVDKIPLTKVF